MSISKISRGLIVAIFVALIVLITCFELYYTFSGLTLNNNIISKIIYVILLVIFSSIYGFIKGKFSKKRIKKTISLTYRYIFLIIITLFSKIFVILSKSWDASTIYIITCSMIGVFSAIAVKKIIYNVSKSDMLSVIGMIMFAMLPNVATNKIEYSRSVCIVFGILMVIVFIQKLIDELKQLGIKTKRYIKLSIITGIFIGSTMLIGINSIIWIILGIIILFVTSNLDKTHIDFPNKIINNIRQKNKEILYSIERMYINKIYISVAVICLVSYLSYMGLGSLVKTFNIQSVSNIAIVTSYGNSNNVLDNLKEFLSIDKSDVFLNFKSIVNSSKLFYLILGIYILIIEVLTVILRRRYDTKSTMIKALFIFLIIFSCIFKSNIYIYQPIYSALFILIAIINTSNLYLNRDERVKLLNA